MKSVLLILAILGSSFGADTNATENAKIKGRIVGGRPININQVPYQASLRYRRNHICGASIISARHCITAAHCYIKRSVARDYAVLVGTDLRNGGLNPVIVSVSNFVIHEYYHERSTRNDIGVLTLQNDLNLNGRTIAAIALPAQDARIPFGEMGIVSGWGTTQEGNDDSISSTLLFIELQIQENSVCRRAYRRIFYENLMFCAGSLVGGKDSCQGDSGGPLAVRNTLIGVVSFGNGCGRRGYPGMYANTAHYRNWIDRQMR